MAASIFNSVDEQLIVKRVAKLQSTSPRQWGTMTPQEMCWHCRQQIEMVLHPQAAKVEQNLFRYQPMKWLAIFVVPWPKGSPTAPSLDVRKSQPAVSDMDTEKQALLQAIQQVKLQTVVHAVHPLFGKLNKHYWGRLIWKHLDHHLRQFNC